MLQKSRYLLPGAVFVFFCRLQIPPDYVGINTDDAAEMRKTKGGLRMHYLILWGAVFIFAVIAECASLQLVSIWFAVGAAGAFTAAFFGAGFTLQFGIFVAVSLLLLIATRPLLKKLRVKKTPAMNADRDIGDTAVVIEEVHPELGTGRARNNGIDWIAVSEDGSVIPKDTVVTITSVEGAKLIVRNLNKTVQAEHAPAAH